MDKGRNTGKAEDEEIGEDGNIVREKMVKLVKMETLVREKMGRKVVTLIKHGTMVREQMERKVLRRCFNPGSDYN